MHNAFINDNAIIRINEEIKKLSKKSEHDKVVKLSVDRSSKNAWEDSLMTYVGDIPFPYIGKGEQSIVKTKLALEHNKTKEANIILIEEPENHLSHTKLNQLISDIKDKCLEKQIIISTHSSFVANKLGLKSLILLNDKKTIKLTDLKPDTVAFFEKISGYDTLRFILSNSAILCEGDSDELLIQKAYIKDYNGKLPIEDGIEVISVGLSFARYTDIAEKIQKRISIVTDNDGKSIVLEKRYKKYNEDQYSTIKAFYGDGDEFPTLEPQILKYNDIDIICKILGKIHDEDHLDFKKGQPKFKSDDELLEFMITNKTDCALKFFDTTEAFTIPSYILKAINHVRKK